MNDSVKNSTCSRTDDLISFLYGESDKRETHDFKQHLGTCSNCQNELAALGGVRESIGLWKTEALSAPRVEIVPAAVRQRSAVAALREFFALSPLWLKGAVSFATVALCVMTFMLVNRTDPAPSQATASDAKYTEQQMKEAIAKALENQAKQFTATTVPNKDKEAKPQMLAAKNRHVVPTNRGSQWGSGKPLSREERQQLASDLRLLSTREEDTLTLIGDRINQEF
jgi:anti-sigma factor RsiW